MKVDILKIKTGKIEQYGQRENSFLSAYKKTNSFEYCVLYENGLDGDMQADKRYHGGNDKALLIASNKHFDNFKKQYSNLLDEGALGENILVNILDEENVYVGDIYKIGDVIIQVTQPRQPCWKIGALFGKEVSRFINTYNAIGWYAKVLHEGEIYKGDCMELIERKSPYTIYELSQFLKEKPSKTIINEICSFNFVAQSYKDDIQR